MCWRCLLASLFVVHVAVAAAQTPAPLSNAAPVLQELGKQLQDTSVPTAERLALVKLLGEWGTAQVRDSLLAVLKDPLPSIRQAAASALGWEGNREATAALRERLSVSGESPAVKAAALESLGKIGDDAAQDVVLAATNDPDPRVRGAALDALTNGRLAKPVDRIELLRRVAEDRGMDLLMRSEAVQQLGKAKDTAAAPLLMRLVEHEPAIAMPLPSTSATQQEVMMVRYRQARDVRAWAAAGLGWIEAKEALPLLLRSAEDPLDFFLRVTSMGVLAAWAPPEAVPLFVRRLADPFADVRAIALSGLARIGERSVGNAVLARLSDPVPGVRVQAVLALVQLGDPRARAALLSLRKGELDPEVQQVLEAALERLAP
jgi:HEAT repeat protein